MNADDLNKRAFFALKGYSLDWAADLIALLRSNVDIDPIIRETLADAIGGGNVDGTTLSLSGNKPNRYLKAAHAARKSWRKIAAWVAQKQSEGVKYEKAIEAAALEFRVSEKKCEAAVTYTNDYAAWAVGKTVEFATTPEQADAMLAARYDDFHFRNNQYVPSNFDPFGSPIVDKVE